MPNPRKRDKRQTTHVESSSKTSKTRVQFPTGPPKEKTPLQASFLLGRGREDSRELRVEVRARASSLLTEKGLKKSRIANRTARCAVRRGVPPKAQFPTGPPKNTAEKDTFSAVFFYPSRRLGISSPHEVWWISSALWAVYHHRRGIPLRLDDIQNFVLMICNSFGIDDIQGYRLDFNVRM